MSFIYRGFLSLKSKKGKTALMFFVFLAIFCLMFTGFIIKSAAKKNEVLARQKLGANVSISIDPQKLANQMGKGKIPEIKPDSVKTISNLSQVKDYQISSEGYAAKDNMEPIAPQESSANSSGMVPLQTDNSNPTAFVLSGVRNSKYDEDFLNKKNKLISGEEITSKNTLPSAIIEEQLAKQNHLKVGDHFKLKNNDGTEVEFEVVGIYRTSKTVSPMLASVESAQPSNQIYINYNTVDQFTGSQSSNKVTFYLKDPLLISQFIKDAKKLNLIDSIYKFDANDDAYEQMIGPLKQTSAFCNSLVIISMIIGGCVLVALTILNIKSRKFEMGILLAMGESKLKIIAQLMIEGFIVAIIAFGVSSSVSLPIGQTVANYSLSQQVQNSDSNQSNKAGTSIIFGGAKKNENKNYKPIKSMKVSLSSDTLIKVSGLSCLILFLSILLPSLFILRLKPSLLFQQKE